MKNKIALFFLVVSLSTAVDPILAGNNIPDKNIVSGASSKPDLPKQAENKIELKKESYIPVYMIFGSLFIRFVGSYLFSEK